MSQRVQMEDNGLFLTLEDAALGTGGEAAIYPVSDQPSLVAKIYHKPTSEHADKLAAMLAAPPVDPMASSGHHAIAWPTSRLLSADGDIRVVGFLMPRVHNVRLVHEFYNPRARMQICPLFHYGYLLRTARNLAVTVQALHNWGYVVGDLNAANLLVSTQALVTLVDTDSFQVPATNRMFRCTVGTPEYTPPELQGARFADVDRGPEHDAFSLSVLIFQLLMQGTHPFAGVFRGAGEPVPIPRRISEGHWPYAINNNSYQPTPHAPPWEVLPPPVQELMRRCFEEGHAEPKRRPTAADWQQALQEGEKMLVACLKNTQHQFSKTLEHCPWCKMAAQHKRDPFPSAEDLRVQVSEALSTTLKSPGRKTILAPAGDVPAGSKSRSGAGPTAAQPVSKPVQPLPMAQPVDDAPRGGHRWLWTGLISSAVLMTVAVVLVWAVIIKRPSAKKAQIARMPLWCTPATDGPPFLKEGEPLPVDQLVRLSGHTDSVRSVAFGPDGRRAVSGGSDRSVRLWNLVEGKELQRMLGHTDTVWSVAVSPDGRQALSGSYDGTMRLWSLTTGQEVRRFVGHSKGVTSVAFSPLGVLAASGSADQTVRMWDIETGEELLRFGGHTDWVDGIAFSGDGRQVVSGGDDKTLWIWDLTRARSYRMIAKHTNSIASVAFSPYGDAVLAGSSDHGVRLWDIHRGRVRRLMDGHTGAVHSVACAPDGRHAASGSADKTVRYWDMLDGRQLHTLSGHASKVNSVAIAPDGRTILSASDDHTIRWWHIPDTESLNQFYRGTPAEFAGLIPEAQLLQGTWSVVAYERDGAAVPASLWQPLSLTFQSDVIHASRGATFMSAKFRLPQNAPPRSIDISFHQDGAAQTAQGVYELHGDLMRLCYPNIPGAARPAKLPDTPGLGFDVLLLRREGL